MKLKRVLHRRVAVHTTERIGRLLSLPVFLFCLLGAPFAGAYSLVEGYYYNNLDEVKPGMFVSLVKQDSNEVEPTTYYNLPMAIGVATQPDGGLLTLSSQNSNVYVATTGTVPTFVSDMKGVIKPGDQLTASPLAGVLMKAGPSDKYVLGVANGEFDASVHQAQEIALPPGSRSAVARVGSVSMFVKPLSNPNREQNNLLEFSEKLVNRPVTVLQVLFSGVFFLLTIITVMIMVGNAIRGSLNAIGRNPLARRSVMKGLLQLSLLAFGILVIGLTGAWMILWI